MHHLADAGEPGRFGQPQGTDDIDRGVELRIGHRMADVDLRRQMKNHFGPVLLENCLQVGVHDVGFDEDMRKVVDQMLEIGRPASCEIIQSDHRVTVCQETVDQCRSDETGRAGDQCTHRPTIPTGKK